MPASAEEMIDRRRLRRKLSFWRIVAFVVVIAAVVSGAAYFSSFATHESTAQNQIARVTIEGMILEDQKLLDLLDELKDEDRVKAVVLRIDSPGGTTVGGEAIFDAVREIAEVKPVAAEVGTLAASAGYMIASATDHIVARQTSIVGSIGVIFQYVDASSLLNKIGVEVNSIKSSPLKAEPSPFGPAPQAAKEMIDRLVKDTYRWFVALVAERRDMPLASVQALADGSIFSGRQGQENGLVDALGGEETVRRWLEEERDVEKGLTFVDREPEEEHSSFWPGAWSLALRAAGLETVLGPLGEALEQRAARLDGLVSLWQPPT